jgi:hypothetical protein
VRRLFLLYVPLMVMLFTAAVVLIHVQPPDDGGLEAVLTPKDCAAPCFLGIRPGVTTAVDAFSILKHHPWVASFEMMHEPPSSPPYVIYWYWNGHQPDIFRGRSELILTYDRVQIVESILVETTIPMGYARLLLGNSIYTDSGHSATISNGSTISALYLDPAVLILTTTTCPVTYNKFWNAPMMLEFSSSLTGLRRFGGLHRFC